MGFNRMIHDVPKPFMSLHLTKDGVSELRYACMTAKRELRWEMRAMYRRGYIRLAQEQMHKIVRLRNLITTLTTARKWGLMNEEK